MHEAKHHPIINNKNDRKNSSSRYRRANGQILLMLALALPLMLTMLGLALDGGRLYLERRSAQIAADAGARSAAFELLRGNNTQASVDEASATDAALNGYDIADPEVDVVALIGPAGFNNNFVSVTVTDQVPTTLLNIFGKNASGVAARAVAGIVPDTGPPCVLALNQDDPGTLTLNGSGDFTANCKIMSNSDNENSIISNGTFCVTAEAIGFVGTGTATINGNNCFIPQPAGQAIPEADPYEDLTRVADIDTSPYPIISMAPITINEGNYTFWSPLQPGVYSGGLQFVSLVSAISIYMDPGVYFVNGLTMAGNVTVTGTDITIIDMCGGGPIQNIDIVGTATAYLSAPTTGDWANILFYSACDATITGTSGSTFEGGMYFPDGNITFGGNQTTETFGMIVGDTITLQGAPLLNVDYSAANRVPDLTTIALVQ
jgi:hypothetical protein